MTDHIDSIKPAEQLPEAVVSPPRRISLTWSIPVIALAVTAYLVYRSVAGAGPPIVISFNDGNGLRSGQTTVKYRGITVGEVRAVTLHPDQKSVVVRARLDRSAAFLAREGSVFWIVRPEISLGSIRGLGTLVSGPYIQAAAGQGQPKKEFVGSENSPISTARDGLDLVITAPQLGFIKSGSPVFYRGIEVGAVQKCDLATNARAVQIYVTIQSQYAPLVRTDSRFWNAGGVDVNFSLFKGLEMSADSFKSLVSGGIAFATPEISKDHGPVFTGLIFRLYDKPEEAWLKWSPGIPLQVKE